MYNIVVLYEVIGKNYNMEIKKAIQKNAIALSLNSLTEIFILYVKSKEYYISIFNHIFFTFKTYKSLFFGSSI